MLTKFLVCRTSNGYYVTSYKDGKYSCESKKINDALLFPYNISEEEYLGVYLELVKNQGYFDIEFILYYKNLEDK